MANYRITIEEYLPIQKAVEAIYDNPPSHSDGLRVLVGTTPTGVFTGHTNDIAWSNEGAWFFDTPVSGWRVWVNSLNKELIYIDGTWLDSVTTIESVEYDDSAFLTGVTNLSSGIGVYDSLSGRTIQLRSIVGSGDTTVSLSGETILIHTDVPTTTYGTLNSTCTTALSTSASESFGAAICLHRISKTGCYDHLSGTPTIPTVNNSTICISGGTGLTGSCSFTLNQAGNTTVNLAHTTYTARNVSATGANIISCLISDGLGHVTSATTRTLTAGDLGACTSIAHVHCVYNSAGAAQFSYPIDGGFRVCGSGITTVGFNAGSCAIIINTPTQTTVNDGQLSISGGTLITGGGIFTANQAGSTSVTLNHETLTTTTGTTAQTATYGGTITMIDAITGNSGHITGVRNKTVTLPAEYVHPTGGAMQPTSPLTGACVFSQIGVNTLGHVTGHTSRTLTASDIGAVSATTFNSYTGTSQPILDSAVTGATNIGTGSQIFSSKSGRNLQLRTLVGSGSTTVSTVGDEIRILTSVPTGLTGACNGLSVSGQNVKLGGLLTEDTFISGNTNAFRICGARCIDLCPTNCFYAYTNGSAGVWGSGYTFIYSSCCLDLFSYTCSQLGATSNTQLFSNNTLRIDSNGLMRIQSTNSNINISAGTGSVNISGTSGVSIGGNLTLNTVGSGTSNDCVLVRDSSGVVKQVSQSGLTTVVNLVTCTAATTNTICNSAGSNAILSGATTLAAGLMTATDKTKLDGLTNETVKKELTKTSHGFAVGDVIGVSGNTYNKAIADGNYGGEILGIVNRVINTNTFEVTQSGYITGLTSLTQGATYFLSPTTSGLITATEPTTNGQISKAVLVADSTTTGWVLPYPGYLVSTGQTGALTGITNLGDGICVYDSTSANVARFRSILGSGDTTVTLSGSTIIVYTDAPDGSLSGLTDTTISSPSTGQFLYYSGSSWINYAPNTLTNIVLSAPCCTGDLLVYCQTSNIWHNCPGTLLFYPQGTFDETGTTIQGTGALSGSGNLCYIISSGTSNPTSITITHLDTAGNKHIPSGGSAGQILCYGGSSGTAVWGSAPSAVVNLGVSATTTTMTVTNTAGDNATLTGASATLAGIVTNQAQVFGGQKTTTIWSGSTCVDSPLVCAATRVQSPFICGSNCVVTPLVCGATNVVSTNICGTTLVSGATTCGSALIGNTLRVITGAAAGCILISDGSGNATWQTPPTIPTVNNSTICISGGTGLTTGGNFTLNQASNATISLNHATYTARNVSATGANIISCVVSDGIGHVTNVLCRALSPSDIGAQPAGTYDNYLCWVVKCAAGDAGAAVTSTQDVCFLAGTNMTITRSTRALTFNASTQSLSGLTDTTISSPTNGQVLTYSGGTWRNCTSPAGVTTFIELSDTPGTYGNTCYLRSTTNSIEYRTPTQVLSDIDAAARTHIHGDILSGGTITSTAVTPANGDYLLLSDADASNIIKRGVLIGTNTTCYLRNDGTWAVPPNDNTITRLRACTSGTFCSGDITITGGTKIAISQSGCNIGITHDAQAAITATNTGAVIFSGITSDSTGHLTAVGCRTLTATDIGAAAASHTHGNINNGGCIGSAAGLIVVTTTNGCLTTTASTTFDNYGSWLLCANGIGGTQSITSSTAAIFSAGTGILLTRTNNCIGISSSVTDTVTRLRGTASGTFCSGDITICGGGDVTATQTACNICLSYTHPTSGVMQPAAALTGACVFSQIGVNSLGHITGHTSRNLCLVNLNDVTITTPATAQLLTYSGTTWINRTLTAVDLGALTVVNLGVTTTGTNNTITNTGGNNAILSGATNTVAGLVTTDNQLWAGIKCTTTFCGTTSLLSPLVCGTSNVVSPNICGTTLVSGATTCGVSLIGNTLRVITGAAAGCVLVSDSIGNATWQSPSATTINLGVTTTGTNSTITNTGGSSAILSGATNTVAGLVTTTDQLWAGIKSTTIFCGTTCIISPVGSFNTCVFTPRISFIPGNNGIIDWAGTPASGCSILICGQSGSSTCGGVILHTGNVPRVETTSTGTIIHGLARITGGGASAGRVLTAINSSGDACWCTVTAGGAFNIASGTTGNTIFSISAGENLTFVSDGAASLTVIPANKSIIISATDTNTATAADDILQASNVGTEVRYSVYNSAQAALMRLYSGTTVPTGTGVLNVGSCFRATQLFEGSTRVLTSNAHLHCVANSAGTNQFSFGIDGAIRFAGSGGTTVTFTPATCLITFSSSTAAGGVTNLSLTTSGTLNTINNSNGTGVILSGATNTIAGLVTTDNQLWAGIKCTTTFCGTTSVISPTISPNNIIFPIGAIRNICFSTNTTTGGAGNNLIICGNNYVAADTGSGGEIIIQSGRKGDTSGGAGGNLSLIAGSGFTSTAGATICGGTANLIGGLAQTSSTTGLRVGGFVNICGGIGCGGTDIICGGIVNIFGGNADSPTSTATSRCGGNIMICAGIPTGAGAATTTFGGHIDIRAGSSTIIGTTRCGGNVCIFGGDAQNFGGIIFMRAGSTTVAGGNGANLDIGSGNGCNGGNVFIIAGTGATSHGSINIQSGTNRLIRGVGHATTSFATLLFNNADRLCTLSAGVCVVGCGWATDWISTSDCRLKTNIQPISNALSMISKLCGVCYKQCDDESDENRIGLIAQEVEKVIPEVVSHSIPSEDDKKYGIEDDKLGLKYEKLTAVLVEAIKEQQKQIDELKLEIIKLKLIKE